jgi:predicted MFS family arabinose efflux permease
MSLFAALPMLLGIAAGRLVDRVGVRRPMLASVALLASAVALPGIFPGVVPLYFAAAGAGMGFMLFHIGIQHAVGQMSAVEDRKANFGWLALGFSISNFVGPVTTGLAIDYLGHRATFLLLAAVGLCGLALLSAKRDRFPHNTARAPESAPRSAFDLLRNRDLRNVFIVTGLLASAWDLFVFVMPIYGTRIGLSATTIGLILASFAAATITVRLALPFISRHVREWPLITATMAIACCAYLVFPLVHTVPLLAAISFLLGLGLGATQPSIMSLIYAIAPAGRGGEAVGLRAVVLNASHTVLPLAFGSVAALGMAPVFWSMSAALAAGGWFANRRRLATP